MRSATLPFQDYEPYIYYALHKLHIPPPHEDHYQDAYFIYQRCEKNYDPSLSKFSTYFTQQFIHFLQSQQRTARLRSPQVHIIESAVFPKSFLRDPSTDWILYYDVFHNSELSPLESTIVKLSLEEFTINEISRILKVSPSTVNRKKKGIKKKLGKVLNTPS
ncbi:sigma-70 family RNA polymerase sigma factor [Halobacillus salinarum]|uniref:Sigma-70 family RNA polymerase sigma factor n=1 Tax=Halobacillus salinarum TaxID=2932257 RepID=A0ABY4EMI8_9BACI|nr:sigma-70 family RNA polymerase sigma factor [Halobacillus salinarum]UOQ45669.1 sigma-70 family RNA polymerase sigma factor [Halobacillus salinarum]